MRQANEKVVIPEGWEVVTEETFKVERWEIAHTERQSPWDSSHAYIHPKVEEDEK